MGHWVGRFVSLSVGWLVELAANVIPLFDDVSIFSLVHTCIISYK